MRRIGAGLAVIVMLAGCGASAHKDQTSAAATCLKNAIASQVLSPSANPNCGDATSTQALNSGAASAGLAVSCTHSQANQYVCDVTSAGDSLAPKIPTGFYDVVYDGRSITYQPSQ